MKRNESIQSTWVNIFCRYLLALLKRLYQIRFIKHTGEQRIAFIVGCQRSGSELMLQIFRKDRNSKVYGEASRLSSKDPQRLRLNPVDDVKDVIRNIKVPLIVLKPLVESQNILFWLEHLRKLKALWLFRHYKDVARSNLNRWGIHNGINDLRPIVEMDTQNWRSENVSDYTRKIILDFFSENMNPYDAAALFWFARNMIFFENDLWKNQDIIICKYEDLVRKPEEIMKRIYDFIGLKFPGQRIVKDVHQDSIGRGRGIKLSAEVEKICNDLYDRLNETNRSQECAQI